MKLCSAVKEFCFYYFSLQMKKKKKVLGVVRVKRPIKKCKQSRGRCKEKHLKANNAEFIEELLLYS